MNKKTFVTVFHLLRHPTRTTYVPWVLLERGFMIPRSILALTSRKKNSSKKQNKMFPLFWKVVLIVLLLSNIVQKKCKVTSSIRLSSLISCKSCWEKRKAVKVYRTAGGIFNFLFFFCTMAKVVLLRYLLFPIGILPSQALLRVMRHRLAGFWV